MMQRFNKSDATGCLLFDQERPVIENVIILMLPKSRFELGKNATLDKFAIHHRSPSQRFYQVTFRKAFGILPWLRIRRVL